MAENLQQLRKEFEEVVNKYVDAFLKQFDISPTEHWWIGDRVGLDNFCFGDCHNVTLEEMVYIVEHNVSYDEYLQWVDYCVRCLDCGFHTMNLQSWHKGAPRIHDKDFDKIEGLKKELNDLINETNNKF